MNRSPYFLLAAALVLLTGASPLPPEPETHESAAAEYTGPRGDANKSGEPHHAPLIIEPTGSPGGCNAHNYQTKPEEEWWKQSWVSNWTLVAVTSIYVVVATFTLWAIRRQANIAAEAAALAEQSAKATAFAAQAGQASAQAAMASVEVALRGEKLSQQMLAISDRNAKAAETAANAAATSAAAAMLDQRPWVMPTGDFDVRPSSTPDRRRVIMGLRNSGKTPMRTAILKIGWKILMADDELPEIFVYPATSEPRRPPPIPPQSDFTFRGDILIGTSGEFELFESGISPSAMRLYIHGEIEYRGVFDEGQPYFTEFCFYGRFKETTFFAASSHNVVR